ncbi:ornithine decarboxylase 1-like [Euwallacea fornicatus]|uniref:ornithine decarboxylase 1-like n=1 Tax=Euwallacea fornicatus TaxID=995702 RepID=UPI00338F81F3
MKIKVLCEESVNVDRTSNPWNAIRNMTRNTDQEEAFYVCDLKDIIEKHKLWTDHLPRVEPHYAVKCNDDLTILELLASLGVCFDCASRKEISKVLSVGVDPARIIFANPAKPISHVRYASDVGVATMTFDNESELHKVHAIYPGARLVVRIRVDARDAQCPLGMKFGCDPVREAPQLLRIAKSLNLNVVGVSFHVGSGCREPAVFRRAIKAARDIFDYSHTLGFNFSLLDIGGGYPGVKRSSISEIAEVVNRALDELFSDLNVRFISEPGRYYVSSAYTLACNIHSVRKITEEDAQGRCFETHRMYYINDGVYGSFNCILYDHQVVTPIPLKEYAEPKISSSVWGPSCDGLDQIIEDMSLPDMQVGEWVVFENMGAYTLPVASPFNGFPIPKVYYVMTHREWSVFKNIVSVQQEDVAFVDEPLAEQQELYNLKIPSSELVTAMKPVTYTTISADLMVG